MTHQLDPWPLWGVELRTPRLVLRPDDDQSVIAAMTEALRGIHLPEEMPFDDPWTDAEPESVLRNGLQYYWRNRANSTPDNWQVNFLVRHAGQVIGSQSLSGKNFAVLREVSTGSWLGMRFHGSGIGTEMRAAVLMLAFDHLDARTARSDAFTDNLKSLGVSRKLGYEPDGSRLTAPRQGRDADPTAADRRPVRRPPAGLETRGQRAGGGPADLRPVTDKGPDAVMGPRPDQSHSLMAVSPTGGGERHPVTRRPPAN